MATISALKVIFSGQALPNGASEETKFTPSILGELAFVLEPDNPKAFVKTITFGGFAAIYTHPLAIMADRKAYRYQLSLFVGLAIGGRWK